MADHADEAAGSESSASWACSGGCRADPRLPRAPWREPTVRTVRKPVSSTQVVNAKAPRGGRSVHTDRPRPSADRPRVPAPSSEILAMIMRPSATGAGPSPNGASAIRAVLDYPSVLVTHPFDVEGATAAVVGGQPDD